MTALDPEHPVVTPFRPREIHRLTTDLHRRGIDDA